MIRGSTAYSKAPTARRSVSAAQGRRRGSIRPAGRSAPTDRVPATLASLVQAESGGNPNARPIDRATGVPRSSAQGPAQITDATWAGLSRNRPDLGLTPNGRTDPRQAIPAADALAQESAAALKRAGLPVNDTTLFAAHFLGAPTAPRVLTAPDETPMARLVPASFIQANPQLAQQTAGQFRQWAERRIGGGRGQPQPASSSGGGLFDVLGLDRDTVIAMARNPRTREFVTSIVQEAREGRKPPEAAREFLFARQNGFDGSYQDWIGAKARAGRDDSTSDQKDFEAARRAGFTGSFLDFVGAKAAAGRDPDTSDLKNYRAATRDPAFREYQKEQKLAGAGVSQLPGEMGARIGLGDQFLTELPGIRNQVTRWTAGERAQFAAGMGKPAEVWRRMETGKEALIRQLTGAGMQLAEAQNQAARYQLRADDSPETIVSKIDGLERDLLAVRSGAIGARSGELARTPAPRNSAAPRAPAVGTIEDGHRFRGGDPSNPASWERVQ